MSWTSYKQTSSIWSPSRLHCLQMVWNVLEVSPFCSNAWKRGFCGSYMNAWMKSLHAQDGSQHETRRGRNFPALGHVNTGNWIPPWEHAESKNPKSKLFFRKTTCSSWDWNVEWPLERPLSALFSSEVGTKIEGRHWKRGRVEETDVGWEGRSVDRHSPFPSPWKHDEMIFASYNCTIS